MALFNGRRIAGVGSPQVRTAGLVLGVLALVGGSAACGGQAVDAGDGELPGSGGTSSGAGGTPSTGTVAPAGGSAPLCFGSVPTTPPCTDCVALKLPRIDSNANCTFKLSIGAQYRLNPEMVTFFFPGANSSRTVIPYVGTKDACGPATTYGGWYASNVTGGDSDIGLCPCTCNAARQHDFKADISRAGLL